jgi:hypothetical protein
MHLEGLASGLQKHEREKAKNREERGEERPGEGAMQRQGEINEGNKQREGLRRGNRLARWRINLKINKRVMEFSRRGWRGSQWERRFQPLLKNERRTRVWDGDGSGRQRQSRGR